MVHIGYQYTTGAENQKIHFSHYTFPGDGHYWYLVKSTTSVNNSQWHYVAGTYEGLALKIYVDGVLEDTLMDSTPFDHQPYNLFIGRYATAEYNFVGLLDEVTIYNRSLNVSEISDLYNNYGYTTKNYPGKVLVRKYVSSEPSVNTIGMIGYINGTVLNNSIAIAGAIVNTNTGFNITTDASGFYSMLLTSGEYNLTAISEPRFYINNSIAVTVEAGKTVIQDIELIQKPKGNITGSITR